jgi:hypothetical protein
LTIFLLRKIVALTELHYGTPFLKAYFLNLPFRFLRCIQTTKRNHAWHSVGQCSIA